MIKFSPLAGAVLLGSCALHAYGDDAVPPARDPNSAIAPEDNAKGGKQKKENADAAGEKVRQVTVTGGRLDDTEQRRQSTAAKLVFGREELDRNGDSTVGEILKRLPGVTISGRPGRGGDIRMRGLGSGYTQILLNGERPPRGFSMDSLSPDQVERIEVYRAPVAEFSTQAIAGTINIVLREDFKMKQTQINLSDGIEQNRHAPNVSITHPGEIGSLSYLLSGSIFENRQRNETLTENVVYAKDLPADPLARAASPADSDVTSFQDIANESVRTTRGVHLTPRFNYRFDNGDTLTAQPFIMHSESESSGTGNLSQPVGVAPYLASSSTSTSDSTVARLFGNWQHRFADKSKVDVKFGYGGGRSSSETATRQFGGAAPHDFIDTASNEDRGGGTSGKYSMPVANGHAFAIGWDGEWRRSTQTRVSLDNGKPPPDDNGTPQAADAGDNLSARTRRLAAFAQDEWEINKEWSTYFGLRWEGVKTSSTTASGEIENSSSVWSPVLHGVWRLPGHEKDQLRMSLTHSYRAPAVGDLIAIPVLSHLNSATSPDRIGNPSLKPELSQGIDFAFEHYLPTGGLFSANLFARNINDLMRRETSLQSNGRWISQPVNIGDARTAGLELEAKFQLADFLQNAPSVDVRANYSRFRSSVDGVPGPNNRLDQQPTQTANFGIDYRLKRIPLTLGGNLNWTPGYLVQSSDTQTASAAIKRQLDVYGLWKFSPGAQLRISANNLVNSNYLTGSAVANPGGFGDGGQTAAVTARTYTTWTAKLELKI
jgi:outer membrane receptor for ferrienterochelin and colicins